MALPRVSKSTIKNHTSSTSFERGQGYYEGGYVTKAKFRDNTLYAEVEGSEYNPYQITIDFDDVGITSAWCSCPYDYEGWCKHIVASLLVYVHEPEEIKQGPSLDKLLAPLSKEDLKWALELVVEEHPDVFDLLEKHLTKTTKPLETPTKSKRQTTLDPKPIRQQVENALSDYSPDLDRIAVFLNKVDGFLDADDAENALIMLDAITEPCVNVWLRGHGNEYYEEYDYDHPFDELDNKWAEAILSAELDEEKQDEILTDLLAWREELGEYSLETFFLAEEALEQGWEEPEIKAILAGEDITLDLGSYGKRLIQVRLQVLESQKRYEEYLNLARNAGEGAAFLSMLVKQEKIEQALENSKEYLKTPDDVLRFAKTLRKQGKGAETLEIAQWGLDLVDSKSEIDYYMSSFSSSRTANKHDLAIWVAELAEGLGDLIALKKAKVVAFKERFSFEGYLELMRLASDDWEALKQELLDALRNSSRYEVAEKTDIFLHEGLIEDAIKVANEGYWGNSESIHKVMDAAKASHSDWVIRLARKYAEDIMDSGKAKAYHHAAKWLEKAKAAYIASGQEVAWQKYLAGVREKHGRKYKLMGYLDKL